MRTAFVTLWLVAVSTGASSRIEPIEQGERLSLVNGQAVVDTFINGQGPFHLLIDTGASRCAVRPALAARLSLVSKRQVRLASLLGQKTVPVAPGTVRVGPLELPETEILINDLPALDKVAPHLDGLLGQSFLARSPYLIDQARRHLWFGEAAAAKARDFGSPVPVKLLSGRPVLPVSVSPKSKPVQLLLDSGVSTMVLRCPNRCAPVTGERMVIALTNAGKMPVRKGRLPLALVGGETFYGAETVLIETPSDSANADGSVPLNWFSAVYVDPIRQLIRFAR